MKKLMLFLAMSVLFYTTSKEQQITVALHHNGHATMFYGNNAFSDANNAAQNGDTIYLPGNAHYSGIYISKKLYIIGTGINPDSTTATGKSLIESDIYFIAGSDSSILEGIYTGNSIHFASNVKINDVVIRRCYLGSIYFDGSFDTTHTCLRSVIEQNIITGEIACDNSHYIIIRNNFIQARIRNINRNALVENNILYYKPDGWASDTYPLYSVYNSLIRNNIFMSYAVHTTCYIVGSNNDVMNNLFPPSGDPTCWSSNYSNNYAAQMDTIFVNQSGYYYSFNFSNNYHLRTPSLYPGFNNAGVGVYGGTIPMKEGQLPFNPHISQKNIAPNTDNNGNLNINIKVKAQDN